MGAVRLTIYGQAASKANSRRITRIDGVSRLVKSREATVFMHDARRQIPPACRVRLTGPVRVVLHLFYETERPDLDESVVLDALQDLWKVIRLPGDERRRELVQAGVYRNDRQVREKHVYHHIDRKAPRVEVLVEPMAGSTADLFSPAP